MLIPAMLGLVVTLGACQRPDLFLRIQRSGDPYTGRHVINNTGVGQTVSQSIPGKSKAKYEFKVKNIDPLPCVFTIDETQFNGGGGAWDRIYRINGNTVTNKVIDGTKHMPLDPDEARRIVGKAVSTASSGGTRVLQLEARCDAVDPNDTRRDVNVAQTTRLL